MKEKMFEIGYSVFLGLLGGLITMLYQNVQGKQFSIKVWIMNLLLAGLTAWVIGEFLPHSIAFRDGMLGISGVVSFRIIEFIQVNGVRIIGKATGLDKIKEKDERDENEYEDQPRRKGRKV